MNEPNVKGTMGSDGRLYFNLGEGWIPLEFVVLAKCLNPEGEIKYRELTSGTLNPVEALGMVETMGDTLRARLMSGARATRDDS